MNQKPIPTTAPLPTEHTFPIEDIYLAAVLALARHSYELKVEKPGTRIVLLFLNNGDLQKTLRAHHRGEIQCTTLDLVNKMRSLRAEVLSAKSSAQHGAARW